MIGPSQPSLKRTYPADHIRFQLREHFLPFGQVEHAEVLKDGIERHGRYLRRAFVDMARHEDAVRAVTKLKGLILALASASAFR